MNETRLNLVPNLVYFLISSLLFDIFKETASVSLVEEQSEVIL